MGEGGKTSRRGGRFLAADTGSRARGRAGSSGALGRSERQAGARSRDAGGCGTSFEREIEVDRKMSRTAQEVLEFDKLRELVRLRTTCATGRRAVDALEFCTDRAALESVFSLIREAREWLRSGQELGFGALADPAAWLARLEAHGAVLEPGEFLDAGSLLETAGWLRQQFPEDAAKLSPLAARAASLGDFRELLAAIRRCILPNGEISDDASPALRRVRASIPQTREAIQKAVKQILRARDAGAGGEYVTLRKDRLVNAGGAENR